MGKREIIKLIIKINITNKPPKSTFLAFLSLWIAHPLSKHLADKESSSKFSCWLMVKNLSISLYRIEAFSLKLFEITVNF